MTRTADAEEAIKRGDPTAALAALQDAVRRDAADPGLRVFLFQLLCVLGQWERAMTQLEVSAELDPLALAMRETYRPAIHCELLRADVFAGRKSPMLFGEPDLWVAQLIESLIHEGGGDHEAAARFRQEAFDAAPPSAGTVDGQAFDWIADGDMRLGPVLECIVNGRYYWAPFSRLAAVTIEAPVDLRDAIWLPAHLTFTNGGDSIALLPARYPGSEAAGDGRVALGRQTTWTEASPGVFHGLGQKTLTTPDAEVGLLDVRVLQFDAGAAVDG